MRIFLSAESVRQARIILLRATHLPFVALIWAYEASRRYASQQKGTRTGRPTSMESARYVASHPPAAEGSSSRGRLPGHRTGCYSEPGASLMSEIERLRVQVERLAAVASQQQINEPYIA